jgi:hypothetical protein
VNNNIVKIRWPRSFTLGVKYVKQRLRKLHQHLLRIPRWNDNELKPLGPTLRDDISSCQRRRQNLEQRLAWNVASYVASIDPNNCFAPLIAEYDISDDDMRNAIVNYNKKTTSLSSSSLADKDAR